VSTVRLALLFSLKEFNAFPEFKGFKEVVEVITAKEMM
jgi:hypothetical protein